MLRIVLFLLTNLAVMLVAGIVLSLLGVGSTHGAGNTLQLGNLLVMCFVFGSVGSLISLLMSKWMAKRSMGVQIIESPRTGEERWLVDTVAELSQKAGIKPGDIIVRIDDQLMKGKTLTDATRLMKEEAQLCVLDPTFNINTVVNDQHAGFLASIQIPTIENSAFDIDLMPSELRTVKPSACGEHVMASKECDAISVVI